MDIRFELNEYFGEINIQEKLRLIFLKKIAALL